jgi:hypothetical protein
MTDEKKKGKALNALKKKFNTGGRVNARGVGRRAAEDELGVAVKKPTGFQQMGEVIQTPEPKKLTETFKTSVPKKPTKTSKTSATKTATQAYEELKGDPIGKAGLQQKLASSISPMFPLEQMGYNSIESKDGPRAKGLGKVAGDASNIKSLLSEQMTAGAALKTPDLGLSRPDAGIRGTGAKTDKSFDASKATTEQLKALGKIQENAQSVTASQEYQGLLEEYERTKGDPKIKAQLQQKLAPFQEQQAAIMGTQSPKGAANIQQAQNAGQAVMAQSAGPLVLTLILM